MKLAAIQWPLASSGRHLLALCFTIIFALALDRGVALGMGRGGGSSGGGNAGGGGSGGGHAGSSAGGGHVSAGHVGSVGGHAGSGQVGGGQSAAGHFGHVPGGHQRVFCDHHLTVTDSAASSPWAYRSASRPIPSTRRTRMAPIRTATPLRPGTTPPIVTGATATTSAGLGDLGLVLLARRASAPRLGECTCGGGRIEIVATSRGSHRKVRSSRKAERRATLPMQPCARGCRNAAPRW